MTDNPDSTNAQKTLVKTVRLTPRSTRGGVFTFDPEFLHMSDSEQEEAEEIGMKHGWSPSTFWTAPDSGINVTALFHDMREAGFFFIIKRAN